MTGEPPASPCRVVRRALDWDLSAADVLRMVRDDPHPAALMGAWAGGCDIVASDPVRVSCPPGPPGEVLGAPLPGLEPGSLGEGLPGEAPGRGAVFGGGWIGYLGFGAAELFLPVPPAPGGPRLLPAWWFGFYDHVLRRDRAAARWVFEALWTPQRADALEGRFAELSRRAGTAGAGARGYSCGAFVLTPTAAGHRAAVRETVTRIRRGDIFQANICLRLEAGFSGDPLDAFCDAATRLDPSYAAFIQPPGGAVASLSPELFLRRAGGTVVTRPVKGTRPRPADSGKAQEERAALRRSVKDRAENVMIVDLMRNDLSRVCLPGSVRVPALLRAEPHPGLWHLVSDVSGTLAPGAGDGQLIAASFPPGSVTGAPKVAALETIHELEATAREAYTGAAGYRSPLAGLELNVAIRTFEFAGGRVWLGSGGGITARSDPAAEYRECLVKATPLIGAVHAHLREAPATPAAAPGAPQAGQAAVPVPLRPRPAAGVFTSLRVTGGRAHGLAAHLARLDDSAWRLFGKHLPPGLPADLAACLADRPSGRLRITARPAGGPLRVSAEVGPAGPAPASAALRPVTIAGGLGGHKWADRRLLAALTGLPHPEEHVLINDSDGDILETDRANIFVVMGGALRTPPADGRILPGITRAAVLRLARQDGLEVTEAPVDRRGLLAASEVFLTNSVQGIVPARCLEGTPAAWRAGPVTSRLRALLARAPAEAFLTRGPATPLSAQEAALSAAGPALPAHGAGIPLSRPPPSRQRTAALAGRARPGPVVVVIDNYDSFTYNLAHLLLTSGCQAEVVRNDEVTAGDIAAFGPAGIVISPGPGTPADAGVSVEVVQACAAAIPLLGICLGHQAIAAAYGAAITAAARPVHGTASVITHDGRGVLAGLPRRFRAARYHSLIVAEASLPPELAITARGPGGIPMGLRHTHHLAEGLQFHPESILTSHGRVIIANFARAARGPGSSDLESSPGRPGTSRGWRAAPPPALLAD